jgi:hypothetical protein
MREWITGDDIYAEIIMLRAADERAVALMEGGGDIEAIVSHIDSSTAVTVPCFGAKNLERAVSLADANNIEHVFGLRDRDWYGVVDIEPTSNNLILTDMYDFDACIITTTDVGRRVALVFGDPAKVEAVCNAVNATGPVELAIDVASAIGYLRLASARRGLELALRDFPVHEVIAHDGTVKVDALYALVVARTRDCTVTEAELAALLDEERAGDVPVSRVCSGHDLAAALATLCRHVFGGGAVRETVVLKAARAALGCAEFRKLTVFADVVAWEAQSGARVWHQECRVA